MTDLLNTGKSALFAFQRALSTTSHNIANVNTEGYSRQRVEFGAVSGDKRAFEYVGRGVRIVDVHRIHDEFATARVNDATSAHSEQETHYQMASRLDNMVATDGVNVAPAISEFFDALQDANNDPSSIASREVVLDKANSLADRFQILQAQLDDAQREVNDRTIAAVNAIQDYATGINDINQQVISVNATRQPQAANDLLDQRATMVEKLSEYVDVDTLINDDGSMSVFIGKGISLVTGSTLSTVAAVPDGTYPDRLEIQITNGATTMGLSARLQGGEIGGLSEFTNETLYPAMQELGRMALIMADEMNQQHAKGLDLNGDLGGDLFGYAAPSVFSSKDNVGTGALTAVIDDTSALQATDYLLRFDGASFTATRTVDGTQTTGAMPLSVDGMTISLTGTPAAGDTFIVSATNRAAAYFESVVTDPDKIALASRLTTSSSISNLGDSKINAATILDHTDAALTDPVDIVFTSDTTYDIVDVNSGTNLVTGAAYVQGDAITQNGWSVNISGDALTGDTHRIEANANGRGNNVNGLQLAGIQSSNVIDGTQSFNDAYGSFVSKIGANTHSALSRATALDSLKQSAVERQQAIQGVSLDEEAISLTRYQQAYQASAQIIAAADELFQTILGAIR